jgi:peptidoglycan/xylan/chitin deacetylase (PgdA/CDA1 family)
MKKVLAARVLSWTGLRRVLSRLFNWSGVLVLNYHRVGDGSRSPYDRGLWSATADDFAAQVKFCKSQLEIVAPDDLPNVRSSQRARYGLITFDDGYRDNYEVAFPILKSEGVPATFFIATGFIDSPRVPWWDEIAWMIRRSGHTGIDLSDWGATRISFDEPGRERAIQCTLRMFKSIPTDSCDLFLEAVANATGSGRISGDVAPELWMTWDMLREMDRAQMTIGGHTMSHVVLARASQERQRQEILGCGDRISSEIGKAMRYFSYPVGGPDAYDAGTLDVLREARIQYAFSYYGGLNTLCEWNDYDLRREPVEANVTSDLFRSIVSLPQVFGKRATR